MPFSQSVEGCLEATIGSAGLPEASLDSNLAKLEPRLAALRKAHAEATLQILRVPEWRDDIAPARDALARLTQGARTLVFFGTGGSSLGGQTLAQSVFISAGVLSPAYQNLTITYQMNIDGTDVSAQYVVQPDGTVDQTSTIPVPPFDISVNFTTADPDSGLPVPPIDPTFRDPATVSGQLSLHDGEQYVRFKVILPDASQTLDIGGKMIRNVQVQAVSFAVNGIKP